MSEIEIFGQKHKYERLHVVEFNSDRKRMSIIFREISTGKLILYTKGADDVIISRLKKELTISTSSAHLEQFARTGLRTLCIAYKEISQGEYDKWLPIYQNAQTSLTDREVPIKKFPPFF